MIRSVDGFEITIRKSGGVGKQLPDRDYGIASIGQLWLKFRYPFGYGVVQGDLSLFRQSQSGSGDDGFGQRRESKDGIRLHERSSFTFGEPSGGLINNVAAVRDHDDSANDAIQNQSSLDHGIEVMIERQGLGRCGCRSLSRHSSHVINRGICGRTVVDTGIVHSLAVVNIPE